jgi:hypothetical protein
MASRTEPSWLWRILLDLRRETDWKGTQCHSRRALRIRCDSHMIGIHTESVSQASIRHKGNERVSDRTHDLLAVRTE